MRGMPAGPRLEQSPAEEPANSLSHGLALVAALVGGPYLIEQAARRADAAFVVDTSLFCATIVALYLASTLYHALPGGRAKRVVRVIDHSSIFLLIAGSYTPLTLGVLRGAWCWALFGVVWGLAACRCFAHGSVDTAQRRVIAVFGSARSLAGRRVQSGVAG